MEAEPLVCPACARAHRASERFCESCAMPLVLRPAGPGTVDERRRRARKIKPAYTEGPLVKVTHVRTPLEAEMVVGLLLEAGIPSVLKTSIAGYSSILGDSDVLVAESGAEAAREALAPTAPPSV